MIECLPTCQGPGNMPQFPPITYDAYLTWWYDANYNAATQRDEDIAASVRSPRLGDTRKWRSS